MSNEQEKNRELEKRRNKDAMENRIDQLVNTVEDYTRTERHLEQHSDIGDPKNKEHAAKVQSERKEQIDNLKNCIVNGPESSNDDLSNLKENYEDTNEYMDTYGSSMTKEDLTNMKKKQENRLNSMHQME